MITECLRGPAKDVGSLLGELNLFDFWLVLRFESRMGRLGILLEVGESWWGAFIGLGNKTSFPYAGQGSAVF